MKPLRDRLMCKVSLVGTLCIWGLKKIISNDESVCRGTARPSFKVESSNVIIYEISSKSATPTPGGMTELSLLGTPRSRTQSAFIAKRDGSCLKLGLPQPKPALSLVGTDVVPRPSEPAYVFVNFMYPLSKKGCHQPKTWVRWCTQNELSLVGTTTRTLGHEKTSHSLRISTRQEAFLEGLSLFGVPTM